MKISNVEDFYNEVKRELGQHNFIISKYEAKEIENWKSEHEEKVHKGDNYAGAIGGKYAYEFTPTSIGTIGVVKCCCGEEFEFRSL